MPLRARPHGLDDVRRVSKGSGRTLVFTCSDQGFKTLQGRRRHASQDSGLQPVGLRPVSLTWTRRVTNLSCTSHGFTPGFGLQGSGSGHSGSGRPAPAAPGSLPEAPCQPHGLRRPDAAQAPEAPPQTRGGSRQTAPRARPLPPGLAALRRPGSATAPSTAPAPGSTALCQPRACLPPGLRHSAGPGSRTSRTTPPASAPRALRARLCSVPPAPGAVAPAPLLRRPCRPWRLAPGPLRPRRLLRPARALSRLGWSRRPRCPRDPPRRRPWRPRRRRQRAPGPPCTAWAAGMLPSHPPRPSHRAPLRVLRPRPSR